MAARALGFATGVGLLLQVGCFAWAPWTPDQAPPDPAILDPSRAISLTSSEPRAGGLDCSQQRCQQWFRVDVARPGVLRVEAELSGLADPARARLVLQDGRGRGLATARSVDGLPLRVEAAVEDGPHAVMLQAGGGPVLYRVTARVE